MKEINAARPLRLGLIGFGQRGMGLLDQVLLPMTQQDIAITAVCDTYADRAQDAARKVEEFTHQAPLCTQDYHDVVRSSQVDAVAILSAWESHIPIAVDAMRAGKYVGMEVGGAYSIDQCWQLVRTSEETGVPCMLLENCCYGRREMMVLHMVRQGVLGEIVHCSGGYRHDLRQEVAYGQEIRHYRLRNYLARNCENYPTHELGPIAQILNINRGNRLLTLTSTASCAKGLHTYIAREKEGSPLLNQNFAQGDVVTTVLRCAQGQTITLTLDTTLPRFYSRGFHVQGTKGMYTEDTDSLFLDQVHNRYDFNWKEQWGNACQYEEQYEHPLWREYKQNPRGGHDGMDWLVWRDFIESAAQGVQPPIDVYDAATWMSISVLSEQSILSGSAPVAIPDFTDGRWIERRPL